MPWPIRFACSCSRERSANALRSMGEAEVNQLLTELEVITIDCQFCNQVYRFGSEDVDALFGDQSPDSPLTPLTRRQPGPCPRSERGLWPARQAAPIIELGGHTTALARGLLGVGERAETGQKALFK